MMMIVIFAFVCSAVGQNPGSRSGESGIRTFAGSGRKGSVSV
jgi:hypothetical protein